MAPILKDCWQVIMDSNLPIESVDCLPLANIHPYLAYFQLQQLDCKKKIDISPVVSLETPSFYQLTHDKLISLRLMIYKNIHSNELDRWVEKLIRFIEINLSSLKKKVRHQWNSIDIARLVCLHVSALLLDFAIFKDDLRCLNTVLKIMDMKWIFKKNLDYTLMKEINSTTLFQFRLFLVSEYIFDQIRVANIKK